MQPTQGRWYPPTALEPAQAVGVGQRQEEVGAGVADVVQVLVIGGGVYVFDGMLQGVEVVVVVEGVDEETDEDVELGVDEEADEDVELGADEETDDDVEVGADDEMEYETGVSQGSVDSKVLAT